jgi:CO/xanthine dehydrogenase Mo-binding subunit
MTSRAVTRRDFLIRTGWLAAGTTVLANCSLPTIPTVRAPRAEDGPLWLQVLPDGRIRLYSPKSEMGQGIYAGFAQIVAEELNVAAQAVEVLASSTNLIPPSRLTAGSMSMSDCFEPISLAAAHLREALRLRAAHRNAVVPAEVQDGNAGFILPGNVRVDYAELVNDTPELIWAADDDENIPRYALSRTGAFEHIGRSSHVAGHDAIVTGNAVYSRDVALPDMVFGQVLRAPQPGAIVQRASIERARSHTGVIEIFTDTDRSRIGIVAEDPFALRGALIEIEVEWAGGVSTDSDELAGRVSSAEPDHTLVSDGDPDVAGLATHRVQLEFETSPLAHAAMEPRAGMASVSDEGVEVWTGSQDPWYMQGLVADITGHDRGEVVVHNHRMGGAFGGRKRCQATLEAVWLSDRLRRPVRVQWSREDEFRDNFFQPPFFHRVDAGVDDNGALTHWLHDFRSCPIVFDSKTVPESLHWLADIPADLGTSRGAIPPYRTPNRRIRFADVRTAIHTGQWRGLGAYANTTAIECAMDELAHKSGIDAIELRLRNLSAEHDRLAGVLREVARLSRWGTSMPAGRGRGIACAVYEEMTYVAVVVEVDVESDVVKPTLVWCAHDCGLVIHPDQVRAQIEGNIAWGVSVVLGERVEISDGANVHDNFDRYPILRHAQSPDIEISLVQDPKVPPSGVGEPTMAPTPAAVLNAIFAATGFRPRKLPVELPKSQLSID